MGRCRFGFAAVFSFAAIAATPALAAADETDNFTCRLRPLRDAQQAADEWINGRIAEALARANKPGIARCDAACAARELRASVGRNVMRPPAFLPHAALVAWIEEQPDIDHCRLKFRDTIYGRRPYHLPWLWPFHGRIMFVADSIRLAGRIVGTDKLNHFLREGLAHWRDRQRDGRDLAVILQRELGSPDRPCRASEYGLRGYALTGVLSYADLAASYSGYAFWDALLTLGRPESYVAVRNGRYVQQRPFRFSDHVTDAWDEGLNPSLFHPALDREVEQALRSRGLPRPVADCRSLAGLPQAALYVNPVCLPPASGAGYLKTTAAPANQ